MTLQTINIKGKQYVTVNERLKAFRETHKDYSLETELVEVNDRTALIRALIKDPAGRIIATGTSFERADNKKSMVNATSHVENCETSAWGRALGNFGIGIDTSVASADEIRRSEDKPAFDNAASKEQLDEISSLCIETKTDGKKLFAYFGAASGDPTKDQALKMLASLKAKLAKQLDTDSAA